MQIVKNLKNDFPASIVVFFVALPLCLGIALASGAPLFSGIIAGIVGGIVVGILSGSQVGVSGPAAGLAAIVLTAITALGGFENFLVAVVLAGIIQILLGVLRLGVIAFYFPTSVIKGMLSGIGLIIILKQIPHFFGYDADPEGDFAFFQMDGENTFSEILKSVNHITLGSLLIAAFALATLIFWENVLSKKHKIFTLIQGPLVVVILGVVYYSFTKDHGFLAISPDHMVRVPLSDGIQDFASKFTFPNFSVITETGVLVTAFTIALVASLETLLCVEATDKLDPMKRVTPTNRELIAQGVGNTLSGLIGGLPITQVIVRSSANIQSKNKSKLSAIIHGIFLLFTVFLIPDLLNMIPLSVLAAVLLIVGFKLAKPKLFKTMYDLGWKQFVPFIVTILGIVFIDLLWGIGLGLIVGLVVTLIKSYQNSLFLHIKEKNDDSHKLSMTLAEEVTFFKKGAIIKELGELEPKTHLEMDVRNTKFIDHDVIEILEDFFITAESKEIYLKLITESGTYDKPTSFKEYINA